MVRAPVLLKHLGWLPYCLSCLCLGNTFEFIAQCSSVSWLPHFQAPPRCSPKHVPVRVCRECYGPFRDVLIQDLSLCFWLLDRSSWGLWSWWRNTGVWGLFWTEFVIYSLKCHACVFFLVPRLSSLVGKCRLSSTGLSWYIIILASPRDRCLSHTSSHPSFQALSVLGSRVNTSERIFYCW